MSYPLLVAGEPVHLRPAGTLWVEQYQTLVVADLHLEKGSAYAARGQLLPPYDTRETLRRLMAELSATKARTLVLLGDSLHDMAAISRIPQAERQALIELANTVDLIWISGNHDPDGGAAFGGTSAEEITLGHLTLRHEPLLDPQTGEVAGHLHPCAKLKGPAGSLRRRCFISDSTRIIMPAFGAYTGGLNVKDQAFTGMFPTAPCAYLLGTNVTAVSLPRLIADAKQPVLKR